MKNSILAVCATALLIALPAAPAEAQKKSKGEGSAHTQKGVQLAQARQYEQAVAEFTAAIAESPRNAGGYINRGTAYRQWGKAAEAAQDAAMAGVRYQSAIEDFGKAIELAPKDEDGYAERGQTETLMRQYDAALADLNKAIELKPANPVGYKFRGYVYIALQDWEKAITDFTASIEKNPNDPQALDRRAWAYRNLKRFPEAVGDYTAIIEKTDTTTVPENKLVVAEAHAKRGYTYTQVQPPNYKNAVDDYQQAVNLNPNDFDTPQRLQYAKSMLAAQNAPRPAATAKAMPTPKPSGLLSPLNIAIAIGIIVVLMVVIRFVTRGKPEEPPDTSTRIR